MIDYDDAFYGFIYGVIVVCLILSVVYFVSYQSKVDECESKGGVIVKSSRTAICIDKKVFVPLK